MKKIVSKPLWVSMDNVKKPEGTNNYINFSKTKLDMRTQGIHEGQWIGPNMATICRESALPFFRGLGKELPKGECRKCRVIIEFLD